MSTLATSLLLVGLCVMVSVILSKEVALNGKSSSSIAEEDIAKRRKRANDVDVAALQTVIQQQAATIQQLQSQQTATQNEMTALKNSLPASFSPVGFSVRFNADNIDNGIALGTHSTLKFDHVVTNQGNGYDPRDGEFTVPVAGLYTFFLNLMSTNKHGSIYLAIVRNDTPLDFAWAAGSGDTFDQGSALVTVHLRVGDQVWVRQDHGDAVRGTWLTTFSGYLVQAD